MSTQVCGMVSVAEVDLASGNIFFKAAGVCSISSSMRMIGSGAAATYILVNPFCNSMPNSSRTALFLCCFKATPITTLLFFGRAQIAATTSDTSSFFTSLPLTGEMVLPALANKRRR